MRIRPNTAAQISSDATSPDLEAPMIARRSSARITWVRDRALTLTLMAMFLLFLAGQLVTGFA